MLLPFGPIIFWAILNYGGHGICIWYLELNFYDKEMFPNALVRELNFEIKYCSATTY